MTRRRWYLVLLLALSSAGLITEAEESREKGARLNLFVSILPQVYFVERVGGDLVDVEVLVGPGQSPATLDLTPRKVARLSQADTYFRIGVPFEQRLVDKIIAGFPDLPVIDTRRGIELRVMADDHHDHHHHGTDPHIWLDPQLVKIQAATICDQLCRLDSAHALIYRGNLAAFEADLDSIDAEIARLLAPWRDSRFYVFHPSYGYFADAYGLQQVAVEQAGKEPGGRQLTALVEQARQDSVKIIFVQAQFSSSGAEAIATAIGGQVVLLDPLAQDYLNNLRDMAHKISQGLTGRAG
ncbi:MAG: zinc ABC transporter substrate-binding protein [bacterium]